MIAIPITLLLLGVLGFVLDIKGPAIARWLVFNTKWGRDLFVSSMQDINKPRREEP